MIFNRRDFSIALLNVWKKGFSRLRTSIVLHTHQNSILTSILHGWIRNKWISSFVESSISFVLWWRCQWREGICWGGLTLFQDGAKYFINIEGERERESDWNLKVKASKPVPAESLLPVYNIVTSLPSYHFKCHNYFSMFAHNSTSTRSHIKIYPRETF